MKVMTNQMEARGLQSRTEVRQTVAQMAAPNFKDSAPEDSPGQVMIFPRANSYFAPGKLGLCSVQTRTLLRVKSRFASGKLLARRAAMLLILMIGMVGSAWGQIYHKGLKVYSDSEPVGFSVNWAEIKTDLGLSDYSTLNTNGYIGWYVLDKNNNVISGPFSYFLHKILMI